MHVTQEGAGKVLKGIYSAVMAFLGSLSMSLGGGQTLSDLTTQQWVICGGFTLAAFGGVFKLAGWQGPAINGARQPPNGRP